MSVGFLEDHTSCNYFGINTFIFLFMKYKRQASLEKCVRLWYRWLCQLILDNMHTVIEVEIGVFKDMHFELINFIFDKLYSPCY